MSSHLPLSLPFPSRLAFNYYYYSLITSQNSPLPIDYY